MRPVHRLLIASGAILFTGIACDTTRITDDNDEPAWVRISPETAQLRSLGASVQLGVVDALGAPMTAPDVDWRSLESQIVQVDATGRATAVTQGTARIVAEEGTRADTATIEVQQDVATVVVT